MRIGLIGDIHLDKMDGVLGEGANDILDSMIRPVIVRLVNAGVDVIIYLGDVFHYSTVSESAMNVILRTLSDFPDVTFRFLGGNHGYSRSARASANSFRFFQSMQNNGFLGNALFITEPYNEVIDGVPLFYCPYPYHSVADAVAGRVEGATWEAPTAKSIVLAHFTRKGCVGDYGHVLKSDGHEPDEGDPHIYISGHIHQAQVMESCNTYYPGTLYQTTFGESPKKGYAIADVTARRGAVDTFEWTWIPLKQKFLLKTLHCADASELPEYKERVYYKIVASDLQLPRNYLQNNPNVTISHVRSSKVESNEMRTIVDATESELSIEHLLSQFLKNKGHTNPEVAVGLRLLERYKV